MNERRRALGRGLGALISGESAQPRPGGVPSSPQSQVQSQAPSQAQSQAPPQTPSQARSLPTQNSVYEEEPLTPSNQGFSGSLPVDRIDPNPDQPRRRFDPSELERLAASILEHGVIQPVVVRQVGERYQLIVGERRWRASRAAGLTSIPGVIAELTANERLEVAIVENVQRHDLNPVELAHAYRALAETGATQDEIGKKVSQDRSSVANHLRLLELSRDVQEDLEQGRLRMGHAKALLQVPEGAERGRLRDRIVREGLSVRAAEKSARAIGSPKGGAAATPGSGEQVLDPNTARSLEMLQNRFQARVRLQGGGQKGRIEIDYFDPEDFHRIFSLLMGEA